MWKLVIWLIGKAGKLFFPFLSFFLSLFLFCSDLISWCLAKKGKEYVSLLCTGWLATNKQTVFSSQTIAYPHWIHMHIPLFTRHLKSWIYCLITITQCRAQINWRPWRQWPLMPSDLALVFLHFKLIRHSLVFIGSGALNSDLSDHVHFIPFGRMRYSIFAISLINIHEHNLHMICIISE